MVEARIQTLNPKHEVPNKYKPQMLKTIHFLAIGILVFGIV